MKVYWVTVGIGALVAVVGGVLWTMSDQRLGLMLILGGLVVAILGLVMRLVEWVMNKGKKSPAS